MSLAPSQDPVDFSRQFHLEEWKALRAEVGSQIDHTRRLELVTVAGLGAFYAWFESARAQWPPHFLLVVPLLLIVLAALRAWGALVRVNEIASYLASIEDHYALRSGSDLVGWENTRKRQFPNSSPFRTSATLFWLAAFAVGVLAFFFL